MCRFFLWFLIAAAVSLAQTNKGRIAGTVFDPAGAVVPGAHITVTNTGTNESIPLTASESGSFSAPLLDHDLPFGRSGSFLRTRAGLGQCDRGRLDAEQRGTHSGRHPDGGRAA